MISIFTPIRKGSKRIINKNFKPIKNYKLGLFEIKIKQLQKLQNINKKYNFEFIISTDSKKVENYCKKFKWVKIHKRKKSLAGDHSLQKLINITPKICKGKYILWTHVTSPMFASSDYLDFLNNFFKKKKRANLSAFSADKLQKFIYKEKKGWISHSVNQKKWPRTQDLKPIYALNSAAIISHRNTYIKDKNRLCKNPIPIISSQDKGFDVDTIEDFKKIKNLKIKF